MNLKLWIITLLKIYSDLETVCGAIDKLVYKKGIKSHKNKGGYDATLNSVEDMLNLIDKKIKYINIKLLIDKCIKNLPSEYASLIVLRYLDCFSFDVIAEITKAPKRSLQRKMNAAIGRLSCEVTRHGYSSEKFFEMFKQEKWILGVYYDYENDKRRKKTNIANIALKKCCQSEINQPVRFAQF